MTAATPIESRHVLVIGAGPGLGAAIARRFGREAFAVTLAARSEENLASLASELRSTGVNVDTLTADAGDPYSFRKALEGLAETAAPDVVVYNAAVIAADNILTDDTDYLQNTYAVNVLGAITAAQVFTPAMRQARSGTFLATGGYVAVSPQPPYASLSLGKAGLRAALTLMHDELKADGVHAASITIAGAITPGTALDPDTIADTYWNLHTQPAADWNAETVLDGQ
jgi:short-subunit dehydrogenase